MAFDIIGALSGTDIALSIALVILIVVFFWVYGWSKKQAGPKIGFFITVIILFLTVYSFPELIWILFILFILGTFGKDLMERIPK